MSGNNELEKMLNTDINRVSDEIINIAICAYVDEVSNLALKAVERKRECKVWLDKLAVYIITKHPKIYNLMCKMQLNVLYAKIMGEH